MIFREDFDRRFQELCLLTRVFCSDELKDAYFQKLKYYEFPDFDYACRQTEENEDKITLKSLLKYIFESKDRYKTTKIVNPINSLFVEENIKNCNCQCRTCSLKENQSCKELSLAMLCYVKEVLAKRLTFLEADQQLKSDFPMMSFPALENYE